MEILSSDIDFRKKVLIITRNLPPLAGGMERLNWHIADELSKTSKVTLLSHQGARNGVPPGTEFHGVPLSPLSLFLILTFIKTFWLCLTKRPDILLAGSGLTAPIAVFWAKTFNKKSLVYIHGLDIGTNNAVYNWLWLPFIRWADHVIANSSPTYMLCVEKGVSKKKLNIIHPGVSFPPCSRNATLINQLRQQYHLQDSKVLISVGRLTERKGLNEFIELSLAKIIQDTPNTKLVIIGDTPIHSLNKNLQSRELILSTARRHGIEANIIFTGNINDDQILASFYYLANVHVFPVKHIPDDPEGFGMVAIEAAAHGLPTVAFATGGVIDAVADGQTGYLITSGDYEQFAQKTIVTLQHDKKIWQASCKDFAQQFAWHHFGQKILSSL